MIRAVELTKTFPKKGQGKGARIDAIRDVSFCAEDGRITGLLGGNGAGKSTTLRIISTLIKADSGEGFVDDIPILRDPLAVRQRIGFLPHNAGIYPRLTAVENIRYYAELCGMSGNGMTRRIDALVDMLDMGGFAHRRAEGFSQGQRTKVGLARAIVHRPKNIILDEPTNGLDVMATRSLRELIRELKNDGHCILFSTHIMQEVAALCDHIAIISDGRIAMADTLEGIHQKTGELDLEDAFVAAASRLQDDKCQTNIEEKEHSS